MRVLCLLVLLALSMACGHVGPVFPPPVPSLAWEEITEARGEFIYSGHFSAGRNYRYEDEYVVVPLPIAYQFTGLVAIPTADWTTKRGTCALENRTLPNPVFWFSSTESIAGLFPGVAQQWFNFYPVPGRVRGLRYTGTLGGAYVGAAPQGSYAVESVFWTDRFCTDGGREFGFARLLWNDQTIFYFSDYTNCEGDICRVDAAGTKDVGARPDVFSVVVAGLPKQALIYEVYIVPGVVGEQRMRVSIRTPGAAVACGFGGAQVAVPCTAEFPIRGMNPSSFYRDDLRHGYFESGSFVSVLQKGYGEAQFVPSSVMTVDALQVAR